MLATFPQESASPPLDISGVPSRKIVELLVDNLFNAVAGCTNDVNPPEPSMLRTRARAGPVQPGRRASRVPARGILSSYRSTSFFLPATLLRRWPRKELGETAAGTRAVMCNVGATLFSGKTGKNPRDRCSLGCSGLRWWVTWVRLALFGLFGISLTFLLACLDRHVFRLFMCQRCVIQGGCAVG